MYIQANPDNFQFITCGKTDNAIISLDLGAGILLEHVDIKIRSSFIDHQMVGFTAVD